MSGSLLFSTVDEKDCTAYPESLGQVLKSQTFERTPALRALLIYLWRNRDRPLSEYAIATDALGRSPAFDPRTDATVRVQVSRLRQRLERYYEKEDTRCLERLLIPLGSHQITVECKPVSTPVLAASATCPPQNLVTHPGTSTLWRSLAILLAVVCITETVFLLRVRTATHPPNPPSFSSRIWTNFVGNGKQTRIALPTPTFFAFHTTGGAGNPSLMFRDTEVNDFSNRSRSAAYRLVERAFGTPSLAENYTVTSDTFAAVRLARYLDRLGLQTNVASSADGSLEALDKENLIGVGTWGTLTPLKPFLDKMNFQLGLHESSVTSRRPSAGEPARIDGVIESPDRAIWPGVIAFLPGNGGQTHLLILAARHTSALVSFLTSTNGLEQLERLWKSKSSPDYFEVVVNSELNGRGVVRTWPVALRAYPKS